MLSPQPEVAAVDHRSVEIIRQWSAIYDVIYEPMPYHGAGPDYSGWRSSITGENYSDDAMDEWVHGAVSEILGLGGRRILELGVGTGLLARCLIDSAQRFVGTDISAVVVRRLQQSYADRPQAEFLVADAAEETGLAGFDIAVMNSVVQHFPSLDYLRLALLRAVSAVDGTGVVYLGDIRDLALLEAFRLAIAAQRQPDPVPAGQVLELVAADLRREQELLVATEYFARFAEEHGLAADIRLKPGQHPTEMNLFRYDVRLRARSEGLVDPDALPRLPWREGVLDSADPRSGAFVLCGVPRPGLAPLVDALAALHAAAPSDVVDLATLLATRRVGAAPYEVRAWANGRGAECFCTPSPTLPGHYDAVVCARGSVGLDVRPHGTDRPLGTDPINVHDRMLAALSSPGMPETTGDLP